MPIAKIDKKVEGPPIKIGTSKGGMNAFMAGIWCITKDDKTYERPVIFLRPQGQPVDTGTTPDPEELLSIDQLITFSQPGAWEWDQAAIAEAQITTST
ncbi:hypothetical protein AVDCRST_MAG81-4084 [uncultured Synechococcales cyanobacterium]|uniref:Uncharacterized protein n=1 Tax=uncultured Synechococcales cyanobacterium TaxID=1936017 RepID=A0A6J4VRX0_9CYAN|nr:hypothetical protein AVDCRST_MAG81-4084 [uncultured Synechococcales cyanobacterium]